jgi:threonine dehydratase
VDDLILVKEDELVEAIRFAWTKYHERIEASAAVSLAAILSGKISTRPAVVVISGGNIQAEVHQRIVEGT